MSEWEVQYWIGDGEIQDIPYSKYWDNEEEEKKKAFYVLDNDFSRAEEYLQKTGLPRDYKRCLKAMKKRFGKTLSGVGMDLAAGNLWMVPLILNSGPIDRLYCLEYSHHRLLKIGPNFLKHHHIRKDKIVLVLGNFYDLHVSDHSLDFLVLVQAFHHSEHPEKLLSEMKRVLKPDGVIIITGEHAVYLWKGYLKRILMYLASKFFSKNLQRRLFSETYDIQKIFPKRDEIYPPDPIIGDHYYTLGEYQSLFRKFDFDTLHLKYLRSPFRSFVLRNN
jgi:ubiquinone/menaquinone biosynthesis C-methylase UbiE